MHPKLFKNILKHFSRPVKKSALYLFSIMLEPLVETYFRITDATTTTSQIFTGQAGSPAIKMVGKSVMQEKRQTDAIPPASLMAPQLLWHWELS